jgi:hypothetical protein
MYCEECREKIVLPALETTMFVNKAPKIIEQEHELAQLRSLYESCLVKINSYVASTLETISVPRCYICCHPNELTWKLNLQDDLSRAGIIILEQLNQITERDFILPILSPGFKKLWDSIDISLEQLVEIISFRLASEEMATKVIPLMINGDQMTASPFTLHYVDFRDDTYYLVRVFDFILGLYQIPPNHTVFQPLRDSLYYKWAETLGHFSNSIRKDKNMKLPTKVFISYSHKDEEFKDELVTMLAGLQRRGVIDAWQDRRIEEGDEWYQEIQDAMNECDLAILLISANFIASSFIQDEELTRLLKRRMEEGLRVVPVIVKPCMWQSEPALKGIQGLPRDGKPVITFSKENGDRDQTWMEIAKAIEKRAR